MTTLQQQKADLEERIKLYKKGDEQHPKLSKKEFTEALKSELDHYQSRLKYSESMIKNKERGMVAAQKLYELKKAKEEKLIADMKSSQTWIKGIIADLEAQLGK